ncbi:PREDICTED: transcription elongation factor B polypeptide 3 [Drosophila arizonae]|uniref:Transcription elongation factor B polypeptide 3 n=1 Tax=Drosophila arizonae TaxID=7263 RepID=A0ABM1NL92_DROAR|nr:PREDICTED: transcription elongation factor B polypeptide 3 [Drosophila arizonae]
MTSTSNLVDVVRHYQRSIERHAEDETRLLHCITKLFNLPITFEHLQETGIGKTVNALRKINGEVGVAAKTLVTKWKAMVAAEEEPAVHTHSNEEESNRSNGQRSSEEDQDQENKGSNSSGGEEARHRHKSKREERSRHSEHKNKSSSSSHSKSHSKSRSDSDKKHKSSSHDKSKPKDSSSDRHQKEPKISSSNGGEHRKSKESLTKSSNNHHKSSTESNHHSSGSHNNVSSGSSSSKHHRHQSSHKSEHSKSKNDKSNESKSQSSEQKVSKEKSEKHKSSSTSTKSSKRSRSPPRTQEDDAPKAKISKTKPMADAAEPKETANEFDSSMGANFDDVLGMLNMPMSGKKVAGKVKSPQKPKTSSTATSSTSIKKPTTATTTSTATATTSTNNRMSSTKKPELLAPTAKLEPLDPSIALELPTISNNYKPMPLNQTVMDCVFNQGLGSSAPRQPRNFNESEALAAGISSKTMRTKIYSGVRTGQILQVPSLFDLCTRVLQKNIDALEYTGGVPFDVLRPVLERATPQQLLNVEEYNPYLMEDSDVLWQQHVQRHCRSQRREEMETWREMFLRCEEEKERKLSTIAESIKASQKISEAPVRKTQLAFVDSMVKPPRNVQRKQEQYGTKGKLIATPAARVAALSSVTPNAAKVGDARLRVIGSGRDAAQVSAPVRNKKAPLMAKALQLIRGRRGR